MTWEFLRWLTTLVVVSVGWGATTIVIVFKLGRAIEKLENIDRRVGRIEGRIDDRWGSQR